MCSPDNTEGAIADGAVRLHVRGDGRRLVIGRRCRQDGALRRALRTALHQRHRHTHGDARVPRGAAYSRHPTARRRLVTADSTASHRAPAASTPRATITTLPTDTRQYHRLLLYYSCSNDYKRGSLNNTRNAGIWNIDRTTSDKVDNCEFEVLCLFTVSSWTKDETVKFATAKHKTVRSSRKSSETGGAVRCSGRRVEWSRASSRRSRGGRGAEQSVTSYLTSIAKLRKC